MFQLYPLKTFVGFLTDSLLKFIFLLDPKFFMFLGSWSCSVLSWECNFNSNKKQFPKDTPSANLQVF